MFGSVVHHESGTGWTPPPARPQPELEWQAWLTKGRERDLRKNGARVRAVKWASAAVLLATAAFWSQITPYDVVVRFIVTGASLVVMSQAFRAKSYGFAAVFGVAALLYNPVAPVFAFSGDWQRAVVVASAAAFVASLFWRSTRTGQNV
jgi:hypothetical protein